MTIQSTTLFNPAENLYQSVIVERTAAGYLVADTIRCPARNATATARTEFPDLAGALKLARRNIKIHQADGFRITNQDNQPASQEATP